MGIHEGPRSDLWRTPKSLRDILMAQYFFDCDLAACSKSSLAIKFYSDFLHEENSFTHLHCWLNPPFSQALAFFEHASLHIPKLVGIYKTNFETEVWQRVLFPKIDWLFCPDKRIAYEAPEGIKASSPQFCSVLFGWGTEPVRGIEGYLLKGCQK